MSFSNTTETAILNYIKNTNPSWHGATNFYWALHTADPGEAGSAVTSEATYTSYARVVCTRATDLTVSGNTISNTSLIQFPTATGGSETITYASLVTSSSGAGDIIFSGALTSSRAVSNGIQPQFAASTGIVFTLD